MGYARHLGDCPSPLWGGSFAMESVAAFAWNTQTRLPISAAASQQAVSLLRDYGLAHGLGIPDALIAAIALEGNHTLVTSNLRHFDLSLIYV